MSVNQPSLEKGPSLGMGFYLAHVLVTEWSLAWPAAQWQKVLGMTLCYLNCLLHSPVKLTEDLKWTKATSTSHECCSRTGANLTEFCMSLCSEIRSGNHTQRLHWIVRIPVAYTRVGIYGQDHLKFIWSEPWVSPVDCACPTNSQVSLSNHWSEKRFHLRADSRGLACVALAQWIRVVLLFLIRYSASSEFLDFLFFWVFTSLLRLEDMDCADATFDMKM